MANGLVFDIRHCHLNINGQEVTGMGSDGFGITPGGETEMIEGLYGKEGFSVDPDASAEITVQLLARSDWNTILRGLKVNNTVFPVNIVPDPDYEAACGFKKITIAKCMIQKFPEVSPSGKSAPNYEWAIIGSGFDWTPV